MEFETEGLDQNDFKKHCIRIAVQKVEEGKYEEAIRFLEIVQRRRHENSKIVEEFINELKVVTQKSKILQEASSPADSFFLESQLRLVQMVLKQKNFYNILNVSRDASEKDIRKSYKRLLLQLHPDKNCSPDAAIAFQLVNKAFSVLSDETKRKRYDSTGGRGVTFCDVDSTRIPHAPKPPNEKSKFRQTLSKIFFAKSDSTPKYMRTFSGTTTKTLLGSLVVAVFLSMVTIFLMQSDQLFSFTETSTFNVRHVTHHLRIPYYVKAGFVDIYRGDILNLEKDIETQFVTIAEVTCKNERRERDNALMHARQSGNNWEYARIYSIRLKSCDVLMRLGLYKQKT